MNNRFIIVIGSHNNAEWVEKNLGSVLCQDYTHYELMYFNDASEDDTYEKAESLLKGNPHHHTYNVIERKYKTWFFYGIETNIDLKDNDILVFLDGDDMLSSENVLSYLNDIYNQTNCWMTYGGMQVWDGENFTEPFPQNTKIPEEIIANKAYRKDIWRTSHLKTMRGFLWKKFNKEDLKPEGTFGPCQDDLAIMFAMLEMCPPEKVYRVTDPLYIYNASPNNGGSRGCTELKPKSHLETIIRNIPPYKPIEFVTPTLAGGLGNQIFEIAVAASLAKDNGAVVIVNPEEHILPNQGNNVKKYVDNIFSNIMMDSTIVPKHGHRRDECTYAPIQYKPNLKLFGHFQSWKYFDHNREYIQKLFTPNIGMFLPKTNLTAIQVRRGDYYKFPDHHPQLTLEYYAKAVAMANTDHVVIYSDDIAWCKENLKFDGVNITFAKESSDWEEMMEMSTYKKLIISNSSFGWWAAYLNTRSDKQIYAPNIWFGKVLLAEGFNIDDLVLPDWNKI